MRKKLVPIFMLGMIFAIGWTTESDPETVAVENEPKMITAFAYYPIDSECTGRVQDTFHQLGVTLSKEVCEHVKTGHPDDLKDDLEGELALMKRKRMKLDPFYGERIAIPNK